MIENLGLKNAVHSLVQVMSRDGDDTTMHGIQNTVRRCLKEGEDLWSAPGVDATASAHQDLMDRIHRNQKQIGSNKVCIPFQTSWRFGMQVCVGSSGTLFG